MLAVQVMLCASLLLCGKDGTVQPASVIAHASAGAALLRTEASWLNPAAAADTLPPHAVLFYAPSRFGLAQLASFGVLSSVRWSDLSISAGVQTYGFSLYRESTVSLTAATTVGPGRVVGLTLHGHHLALSRYGAATAMSLDIGSSIPLSGPIRIGAAVRNITGAGFGGEDDIPRSLITGFALTLDRFGTFMLDVVKEERYDVSYRAGVELLLHDALTLRAGTQSDTRMLFGGCSLTVLPFRVDLAVSFHPVLGMSRTIGIIIE